ncbi:MAG: xanthine dehydrogenase family protein molybdopterin-binding subunit [Sulfuricaulis sp.]|uniref:xanthine dehydrogenase family protein molybdopterin-binding subunit n=1 Tax=Sulfuricaulis sp. TaxID=2003553 RepID=UPI003C4B9871
MNTALNLNRREFLKVSAAAGGGLLIGLYLPGRLEAAAGPPTEVEFMPNAFLRIAPDNTVTVISKHLEMGQGVYTGLPTIVADELDADWSQIRVESAPADARRYGNLAWGGTSQGTGGSTSTTNSWEQLRRAGATARAMLIAAAAQTWKVDARTLRAENGFVIDTQGKRRTSYGELASLAATLTPPEDVKLKTPKQWKLIGKYVPRTDSVDKSTGAAIYASDFRLPGMLTALVTRPPLFGAKSKGFNAEAVKAMPGVKAVVAIPQGVAVVATDFWSAKQARDALHVEWDDSAAEKRSSDELLAQYMELAKKPGAVAHRAGDIAKGLAGAAKKIEATFEFPYLAHAPMEPLACVVRLSDNACEVWAGSQQQTLDQATAARITGLKTEQVTIHTLLAGGSFGRHANPTADYVSEGVEVAKATRAMNAPIRLLWTREDDIRGGYYRPLYVHTIATGLDKRGRPLAWQHRIVGQSILAGTAFGAMIKDGIDFTSVEGASNLPYAIPNMLVDLHTTQVGVPVLWWRSVGSTHNAFSTEVMINELAVAAKQDPVAFRRQLLKDHPRHRGVLDLAAQKAGWGKPLTKGRWRGVAVHESFHSYVAEVVEISIADGKPKVERVVCAVDCGVAVNPDMVRAQMESGIIFGLSAALYGEITLKDGHVVQSNYHDYQIVRLPETPKIEVHIVPSSAKPTGVGEPGVPPLAPALANAVLAATGKPVRRLPIRI